MSDLTKLQIQESMSETDAYELALKVITNQQEQVRVLTEALEVMLNKAYKQNWNDSYPDELAQAEAAIDYAGWLDEQA